MTMNFHRKIHWVGKGVVDLQMSPAHPLTIPGATP